MGALQQPVSGTPRRESIIIFWDGREALDFLVEKSHYYRTTCQ